MFYKILLLTLTIAFISTYYNNSIRHFIKSKFYPSISSNLFTNEELKQYDGINKPDLYLAILGRVFDVTKGFEFYGPGKSYNFFIGKDATRNFITGQFNEGDENEEIDDLSENDLLSLNNWIKFFWKKYKYKGKLIGKYFDIEGKSTAYTKLVKKLLKSAEKSKKEQDNENIKYPSCNVEWNSDRGSHVWCSTKSGGVTREVAGVPRKLYQVEMKNYRCVCIDEGNLDIPNIEKYDDCNDSGTDCYFKE